MARLSEFPRVSFLLLTLNGGEGVRRCLESVKKQIYPKEKIEIIVIDNGSSDDSVKIAKEYTDKVFVNYQNAYKNRADGMRMATGEFVFMMLEQDIELKSKNFIEFMISPLLKNDRLVASFTRDYPRQDQPWITRFISYNPIQADPLLEFLTPSLESTIIEKKDEYSIARFVTGRIPMATHMFFRVSALKRTPVWTQEKDFDHDTIVKLVKSGYELFAYVPGAGTYHNHAKNLRQLLRKRIRNLENHFFPQSDKTQFAYINKKGDILRLFYWIIYANLLIPALLKGVWKFIKFKDWVLLLEPFITIIITDTVLFYFLRKPQGRKIIERWLEKFIS